MHRGKPAARLEACKWALHKQPRVLYSRAPNQHSLTAAALFLRFGQSQEALPPPIALPSASERWPILGEFRLWMRRNRGLTETTMEGYQYTLVALLEALGAEPRPVVEILSILSGLLTSRSNFENCLGSQTFLANFSPLWLTAALLTTGENFESALGTQRFSSELSLPCG